VFVHGEIPDKNAAGSNYLGEYVLQVQGSEAETHYERVEQKPRPCDQGKHEGGFPVSGRRPERDPVIQVVVKTNAHQVTGDGRNNRVETEQADKKNEHAELKQGRQGADTGKLPQLEDGPARVEKYIY
jgi:tRNA(Arg) A34 adenosine deaminase TadA